MSIRHARIRCIGIVGFILAALTASVVWAVDLDKQLNFDIRPQALSSALLEFSRQANVQVMSSAQQVAERASPGVSGEHSVGTALGRILQGTHLLFRVAGNGTIMIVGETGGLGGSSAARLAQGSAAVGAAAGRAEQQDASASTETASKRPARAIGQDDVDLGEIVVTGSHIRGTTPAGSRVEILDRDDIDKSGFATAQQIIQTLPQNFRGGVNEDTFGRDQGSNFTSATSVNLRGLANSSTLVLINGRRIPVAGVSANFFDVSGIPTSAIERIEVLPDGASALYGSDAIAGVVNFILREDYEGVEARVRYGGVTDGDMKEAQAGLVFGSHWESGHVLASYEYYDRDSLANAARDFAADSDLTPFGGDNQGSEFSNPGNILDPLTFLPAFAVPPGQDGTSLTPADLLPGVVNLANVNAQKDLFAEQRRQGLYALLSQELSDGIELFAEARYGEREFSNRFGGFPVFLNVPASNPFFVDPFGGSQSLFMFYNVLDDLGPVFNSGDVTSYSGVVGGKVDVGRGWLVQANGSYSQERSIAGQHNLRDPVALNAALADPNPDTAFNPFGDGSHTSSETIESIRLPPPRTDIVSKVRSANLLADGPIFHLPGGNVKAAVGVDYRKEQFDVLEREVTAAFAELSIPLFSQENRRPAFERLEISVAGRFDDYDDVGTTTNPKVGVVWSPVGGLNVRGTCGKSFKAPNLTSLNEINNEIFPFPLPDPSSPTGSTFSLLLLGNNAELDNETARTWTLGVDYMLETAPEFRLSLTYFDIDFEDRITGPSNFLNILVEEDLFASIITRNPDPAVVQALCNDEQFTGDPAICDFIPIGAIVDARLNNTARTRIRGIDSTIAFSIGTDLGKFDLGLTTSYLIDFKEAISETGPLIEIVDTINNPVDLRARGSITWSLRGLSATAFVNYTDRYTDDEGDPQRKIGSWTTADLNLAYRTLTRSDEPWLSNLTLSINAVNVFDEAPPFANNLLGVGYDPANADPLGRFISFNIVKKW